MPDNRRVSAGRARSLSRLALFDGFAKGHLSVMPGRLYEIRYPNGDFEFDASRQYAPPAVGQTIHRRGQLWRVTSKAAGPPIVVQVELAEGEVQQPPTATPQGR